MRDLNTRPSGCKPDALTAELTALNYLAVCVQQITRLRFVRQISFWVAAKYNHPKYLELTETEGQSTRDAPIPRHIDHLQAIAGADAAQHSMDVILDSLFGEIQVGGDFFIRQPLGDQGNQLLLPSC